jgi:hypothetical protein
VNRYAYPLGLLVLIGIVSAPMLLHPAYLLYPRDGQATDLTITHWPAVAFNVRSLREDGQVPLWRTTIASGGPWAANPLSGLTYPPAWLFFLLPINLTFNLLLVTHLALAALGTYALGHEALGLEPQGAALAGLAFALAPWLSGQLSAGHFNIMLALAWLPIALLGVYRTAQTGQAGGALLAGVAWAAALLNYVQIGAFVAALTLAWFLLVMFRGDAAVGWKRRIGLVLLVPLVSLLLSAILLVPLAEALPYLNRTTLTPNEAGILSIPWAGLLTTLIPTYGGEPEQVIYLGVPVVLLAAVGMILKRDRLGWFLTMTALLATLFALGTYGPLFPLLLRLVPGLSWLRVPPRAWLLVAFSLALLAGRGLDILSRSRFSPTAVRQVTLVGLVILVVELVLAGGLLLLYQPPPPAVWAMAALTVLTVATLILYARSLLRPDFFAVAVLVLTTVDLGLVRAAWTEMRTPEEAFAWGAEAAEYLAQQPGRFRSYSPSYSLPQHTAIEHELFLADGIDPIQLTYYADFLASAGGYRATAYSPTLPPVLNDTSAQPNAARLGLLNVAYVVSSFPIDAEGLVLETQVDETYIYRNEQMLPRAFVVPGAQAPAQHDIHLEMPIDPEPAHITVYTPNQIVVEADLDGPGLLVLGEVWYPGWRALSNGQEIPIHRVEGTLRGVSLDRGAYTIEFRYSPWTAWVGLVISSGTALAVLGYVACRRWRRA